MGHLGHRMPRISSVARCSQIGIYIGVGRFRILGGGQGLEYWGGGARGAEFPAGI